MLSVQGQCSLAYPGEAAIQYNKCKVRSATNA